MNELKSVIEKAFDDIANINLDNCSDLTRVIDEVMNLINNGQLRVSEKVNNEWITNQWVKKAVLLSFKTKNNSIINEHYYILLTNCDLKLVSDFLNKHNLREICLYKNGIGQYNSKQELIQEFICKYDCIKKLHISDKTLTKALERNIMYNNNYFKYIGSKLQI